MRMRQLTNMLVVAAFTLLSACGESGTSSSTNPSTDPSTNPSAATTPVTETAILYTGTVDFDGTAPVINNAFSVLDANDTVINYLDGGDFEVLVTGKTDPDPEGHFNVQKLTYATQLTGSIVLMIDKSDSMARHITDIATMAKQIVTQSAAMGLSVTVYAFDATETLVGAVAGGADPTTLNGQIDTELAIPGTTVTNYYGILSPRITARRALLPAVNSIVYDHTPLGTPTVKVELMVILSDGVDNNTSGTAADLTAANAGLYNVLVVPVGDPISTDIDTYSMKVINTVPNGGTYAQAGTDTVNFISNYYNGFYLHDYKPTYLTGSGIRYQTYLKGNTVSNVEVTYDAAGLAGTITPVCCVLRAGTKLPVNPASIALEAGTTMDFQVVQLWGTLPQPTTVSWTFSNIDGSMTGAVDANDSAIYNVTSNGGAGVSSLAVTAGAWNSGSMPITVTP